MTIVEFIQARLDEDEAEIGPYPVDRDEGAGPNGVGWAEVGAISEVLMASQHRMLREVAAKRLALHWYVNDDATVMAGPIHAIAAIYSDHPDYDEAWR